MVIDYSKSRPVFLHYQTISRTPNLFIDFSLR
nr:MAG TPA: hypothetical protein [Caudoviricetes sp.]